MVFDYAGNPMNGEPYSSNDLPTSDLFNISDHDFSQILNFTPPVGDSQTTMLNVANDLQPPMLDIAEYPQPPRADMPGDYVSGSEYFSIFPASTSPFASGNIIPPISLSMTCPEGFAQGGLPQSEPIPNQIDSQSLALQPQLAEQQAPSNGQKHADPTNNPESGEGPKPKRRRGARKKVRTAEELAIRRENHLQRNRDAAQKCRKKKTAEAEKKEQVFKARQENHLIWYEAASVQNTLESFRTLAIDVENNCENDEYKVAVKASLETILKTAAKLQHQIDVCNETRAETSEGLVMQRSTYGYVQQDSSQDSQGSSQDDQSPGTSSQYSTDLSQQSQDYSITRAHIPFINSTQNSQTQACFENYQAVYPCSPTPRTISPVPNMPNTSQRSGPDWTRPY